MTSEELFSFRAEVEGVTIVTIGLPEVSVRLLLAKGLEALTESTLRRGKDESLESFTERAKSEKASRLKALKAGTFGAKPPSAPKAPSEAKLRSRALAKLTTKLKERGLAMPRGDGRLKFTRADGSEISLSRDQLIAEYLLKHRAALADELASEAAAPSALAPPPSLEDL